MSGPAARSLPSEGWATQELIRLDEAGLRRRLEALEGPQGPVIRVAGKTLVNFSANDYLGLAADPRVARALEEGAVRFGVGSGASRLVVGDSTAHRSLEAKLAAFEGSEAALLFNSGYAANVGIVSALVGKEDVVFSDALNHASLVDGCRLSRAKTVVYPHLDVPELGRLMAQHPGRRQLVVTDAVFSMDGDLAPLASLVELCGRQEAALLVDEAHATGVLGSRGGGLCESLGLGHRVDVRMGTLGKALGVFGAYAATSAAVRDFLVQRARSLVFSTSLPPALCVAAERSLELLQEDTSLRDALWTNIHHFARGLQRLGLAAQPRSAIFPVLLGTPEAAVSASNFLLDRGVGVKAIRPPTVPKGTSRLRFAVSAAHTREHLDQALHALEEVGTNGIQLAS